MTDASDHCSTTSEANKSCNHKHGILEKLTASYICSAFRFLPSDEIPWNSVSVITWHTTHSHAHTRSAETQIKILALASLSLRSRGRRKAYKPSDRNANSVVAAGISRREKKHWNEKEKSEKKGEERKLQETRNAASGQSVAVHQKVRNK